MASVERLGNDGFRLFDGGEMLDYLEELDELLERDGVSGSIHLQIAGGAVISTKSASRVTQDVDVVSDGMTTTLRSLVQQVSQRHHRLRHDWLNDGAKGKRVNIPMAPTRIFSGQVLTVDAASPRYILAMKLVSGRQIDEADCEQLIRELGIRDKSVLLDLVEEAIPEYLRTPGMAYFAEARLANARKGKWRLRFREWRSRHVAHRPRTRSGPSASTEQLSEHDLMQRIIRQRLPKHQPSAPKRYCNALLPGGGRCANPRPRRGRCAAGHTPA